MKIAIFGGSFDPIHTGHIKIIKKALKELDIDYIILVPTYLNPFKKEFTALPKIRLKWLKKTFLTHKKIKISDFEINNNKPTYAIETIEHIKKRFAPKKIYFIIGSDNLATLSKWKNYKKLKKRVEFVVATRPGFRYKTPFKKLELNVNISSTKIRKRGKKRFLPKIVAKDILNYYHKTS
jgi:nicotinate-nucleotide adenylyltransferase